MYNSYKKKPSTLKGYIESIEVSDLVKNDYVGQKDFYLHTLGIKDNNGEVKHFTMRQMAEESKFDVGTYVTFRYNKNKEFKLPLIEAKSFAKTYTPEEIAEMSNPTIEKKATPSTKVRTRTSFRRN